MLLIPYKKFTLNIYRSKDEVESQLAARVTERRLIRRRSIFAKPDPATPFEGVVENGRFNINRLINYRNSFLPYLVGELHDELDVTKVTFTMRLNHFVLVFMVVWFLIFFLSIGFGGIQSSGEVWALVVIPLMALFVYVVLMAFFNWEANKAIQFIEEIWGEKLEI